MTTEPTSNDSIANPLLPEVDRSSDESDRSTSPWVAYADGKKISAAAFLKKMVGGRISVPDHNTTRLFTEAISKKPDRLGRLVALLQAGSQSSDTIRKLVVGLAEATAIKELHLADWPDAAHA